MNPFQSLRSYEEYVYTLPQQFPSIVSSTLVLARRGRFVGRLSGELTFANGFRITINERISQEPASVVIETYGYELWRGTDKLAWYDSQPHPHIPELASTHPHHKHVPPDIKHNRIPAPNMGFTQPNLPALIADIDAYQATLVEAQSDEEDTD